MHGEYPPLAIDARAIARHVRRSVEVMLHVLFASPDEIDRATGHGASDVHRLAHAVEFPTATKTTAAEDYIDAHTLDRQLRQLRGQTAREVRLLQTAPYMA